MPRISRPSADLSQREGNPTHAIQQHYSALMSIDDPEMLKEKVLEIVQPLVGHGMSNNNYKKFLMELNRSAARGLENLQFFLSNFMLAGSGMRAESNEINAIAGMINEDINEPVILTSHQRALKRLVESYGFNVCLRK